MKHSTHFLFSTLLGLVALVAGSLSASDLLTYQGKLADASGNVLPNGQYRLGVRVWDVASGGAAPLWARKYDAPVVGGVFHLAVGAAGLPWDSPAPLTASLKLALSGTERYLEITVMSDANGAEKPANQWQVLSPRQALHAVPYAMNGCPPGTVLPFAGATAPPGWVLCDGTSYNRTAPLYKALADAIGITYGGNATTFHVPDLRGRTAIGAGQGTNLSNRTRGQTVGAETHTLTIAQMPRHDHNFHDPGHRHRATVANYVAGGFYATNTSSSSSSHITSRSPWTETRTTGITVDKQGDDQPHNIMQPSLVLNYIIKL